MKLNRFVSFLLVFTFAFAPLTGCKKTEVDPTPIMEVDVRAPAPAVFNGKNVVDMGYEYKYLPVNVIDDNYRNYYEIFVASFVDSDGDGMGDLQGVISKLDYLVDLGINGIWLMPINPSPSYHKYDVTDYMAIDPEYGTMEDFEELLAECEQRGIKLIMDLVLNHSSNLHPWYEESSLAYFIGDTDNPYYDYYNFSYDEREGYVKSGNLYVESYFGEHMPEFNLASDSVKQEIMDIVDFWLGKGVGGFRLDAVIHAFPKRSDNIEFFKWFNAYCRGINPDVYLVQEAWTNEIEIVSYYESETDSVFNYSLGGDFGLLLTGIKSKPSNFDLAGQLVSWQTRTRKKYESAIDALFLTNHDNDRSAGLLNRNIYAIKHAAALYLLAPGSPFIYYGEEIGMLGKDDDPTRRLPMNWGNHTTFAPPGSTEMKQYFPAVTEQIKYENSILGTYKRALKIRNQNPEIARGTITKIFGLGTGFTGFVAEYNGGKVAVIHNIQGKPLTTTLNAEVIGSDFTVCGYLNPTEEKVLVEGDSYMFPAYFTLVLRLG